MKAFQRPCGLLQRGYLLLRNQSLPAIRLPKPTMTIRPAASTASAQQSQQQEARPFSEIPLKKGWPLLGTVVEYGKPEFKYRIHKLMMRRVEELGRIFREQPIFYLPEMVVVVDPSAVEIVYRAEGKWPIRPYIDPWKDVRMKLNIPEGLVLSRNENWYQQRQPISQFMMKPRKVAEYHEGFNSVTHDLLKAVRQLRDPQTSVLSDVPSVLRKWSFESVALFVLGKRMGCLNLGSIPEDCQEFISHIQNFNLATQDLMFGLPFHKFYPTKPWKRLVEAQSGAYKISMRHIEEKLKEIEKQDQLLTAEDSEPSENEDFVTYMVHKRKMSLEEVTINAIDLLGAGVDTTSYTLAWTLYNLATHPEVQEKLRSEVLRVVGREEKMVTPTHINNMPYLRNCVRETQRLYPLAPNNARVVQEDVVLCGYKVPAGTTVVIPLMVQARLPDLFPEPELFKPERWEKDTHQTSHNKFASLPFSFGPRMCVGRRVAELEMHIALAHLMRNFKLEYTDKSPMDVTVKLFVVPERQLNVTFKDY